MTPWQVLRASRATRAGLGYRVHHGPGGLVHYSTARVVAAAAVAPDSSSSSSSSFCLSREKLTLQQLNRRLASYLQQIQSLERANQRLEHQIQKELDRKCPRELSELDGYLRTASLLQDQISECLSAQAQVKLQLLNAELTAFDLNVRCEKERENRGCVEAELSNLRVQEEELQVHRLPELWSLVNDQTQQLMELQIQHQKNVQGLQAQVSGGVTVEMQSAESSDLIQQLDDLRQTGVMLLDKNQNVCWFNAQVSTLRSPEVTFDPSARSEAELDELRRTAASLEEELAELQALNMGLEAFDLEQTESLVQQLVVLQQREDGLCRDLDSVLQAVAQQAGDHQALLDIKSRLETEIQDYRRLLDGLGPQGFSSLHSNPVANVTSFSATTSPSAFRRNVTANKTVNVQGGNIRKMEVQTVSRGHKLTVRQTPEVARHSGTVTIVQSIRVHSKAKKSPVTSINTSNLTDSFHKSENQRTGALPERTGRESMSTSVTIDKQSNPVEDKAHAENWDLQNSSIVSPQISQCLDEGAVKASKLGINTMQGITTLVPDSQSARSDAVHAKQETMTSKQTTNKAGFQDNETGTNIQAEITKTFLCAEPEVKQGPHFVTHTTTTDSRKQTAAEVKKETETGISAQMKCTKGSIQAKNQDPSHVASLNLEAPAEVVRDAEKVSITASFVSGSHIHRSKEAQVKVPGEFLLMHEKDIERQGKKGEEEVVEVESTSVRRLGQSSALSNAFSSEQNKAMEDADTGSGIASASSGSPDSIDNLEIKASQGITTLVPDTHSARSAAVQAKPETLISKQTSTETDLQTNKIGINIQAEITKTILCAEPEVKQGPHFVTHTRTTDPIKQTATEVKKESETSAQINCNEGSIEAKNQDPAQVVSLSLEVLAEAAGDAGEDVATLMVDMDIDRQENKGEEVVEVVGTSLFLTLDQSSALSNVSSSEQNKAMEDADTGSGIASASSGSPDRNDNLESKTANTEILKKVELEVNEGKVVNGFHDTKKVKVNPTESDNEMVNLVGQEALLCTTDSKKSTSRTDSGVALSFSSPEEPLSPREDHVFMNPTKPVTFLSPEICLGPVETEVLMSMTDQVFSPIDLQEHVRSPDSLLSPNDPEMFLSINDSDTCLSPVEAKVSLTPYFEEEDEEVFLNLIEANAYVRPVEKYILSTKEEGQSLSFSDDQALPEEDRNRKVSISVRDGDSLCFGSFEGKEGSRGTLNQANINSRPTTRGAGLQLSSSLGGLVSRGPGGCSIIAVKEEQLGFGGLYRKNVRDVSSARDRYKDTTGVEDNKDVQNPGGRHGSEDQKETYSMAREVRVQTNNDWLVANMPGNSERVLVKSTSFGSFPTNGADTFSKRGMASDLVASFGDTAANSSDIVGGNAEAAATTGVEGRFRHGSGEWMVHGGRLVCRSASLSSTGSEERMSAALLTATSRPETGRFGSGEWMVYSGSLGRKSSVDGGTSLPSKGKEAGQLVATNPATSPPETGRFGSRGGGEWMVYGDFLRRKSSLPSAGREESPSVAMLPATSPPETRRFGSGGSGEWMFYSGSLNRTHSLAGNDNIPNTERTEILPTATHLATSPPGIRRFGSGGSGEWRVYGGSTGRLSSSSSSDRVSISANHGQMISPPSSHTSRGPRLSSAGSGGRLTSRSVVRRSSSVGSGGILSTSGSGGMVSSSSGSHRTSSSGRFNSTGSGEWKPVYSSANARKSSVGRAGRSSGGCTTSRQRTPSPGGRMSVSGGSGGWLSSSTASGNRISSPGSASKLSSAESSDRVSSRTGRRISSFSGSGRTNSTGGRVISSSNGPIRSTGSGAGGKKERISVCKMAALSISAAGRERSQDRRREGQRSQQQAAGTPLVQRWLTTAVGVTSADPDGLDDIMRL